MFHIVKDKDGNERVMNDKEFAEYKSLNAAGDFVQAVAISAAQSGGLIHALNMLLIIGGTLLYILACIAYKVFPPDWTTWDLVGFGAFLLLVLFALTIRTRWWALLANVTVVGWLLYMMVVAPLLAKLMT